MSENAIEVNDLVKKYPSSVRASAQGPPGRHASYAKSPRGILDILMRKGSYLTALDNVTLKVKEKEVFGLLGPNGAGKTTLINILCTLVLPDGGEAYVNGFDVQKEPQKVLRNLQAVSGGNIGFEWRLTGLQNLEFYSALYGLTKQEGRKKIDYLLDLTGMKERAGDMYQKYSTGMRRRLILCRALLHDAPILLFDEPTIGLDPPSAAEFRELMHDKLSRGEGKTVLVATHNMWEAQEICDHIAILNHGKVIACDSPDNIRRLIGNETIYDIYFQNTEFREEHETMLKDLRGMSGVKNAVPRVIGEGIFQSLRLSFEKDHNLSDILRVFFAYGLVIGSVSSREPALEEAFIALTREELKE